MKSLSETDLGFLAGTFGLSLGRIKAIVSVESSGSGFDKSTGKIKIQFEPHIFKRYLAQAPQPVKSTDTMQSQTPSKLPDIILKNGVENQTNEWKAYEAAYAINANAAMLGTSWGLGQIMGFNHKAAGFNTVSDMIDAFKESEMAQLKGMLNFMKANKVMFEAIVAKDWRTFAKYYNGKNYEKYNYHTRLEAAYEKNKHWDEQKNDIATLEVKPPSFCKQDSIIIRKNQKHIEEFSAEKSFKRFLSNDFY